MQTIEQLYQCEKLKKAFLHYAGGDEYLAEEIHGEVFQILCEKPEYVKSHMASGTLEFAAKRIAKNLFTPSNRFFQTVIKPRRTDLEVKDDVIMEDDFFVRRHDALLSEFRKLDFFEQKLIELLLQHGSRRSVAAAVGLDYAYVKKKIKSGKQKLKTLINKKML